MPKITIVCSTHRENGLCNAGELLKIIRGIEPDVVFEEIRPTDFDTYCRHGIRSNLEAQTITKYLEFKSFRRVAVDRYDIPDALMGEIKREFDDVFEYVGQHSREYQLLDEENAESVYRRGFDYLNGDAFATVMTRMAEIEDETINETGNPGLIRTLEKWRHFLLARETAMVDSIYAYCRENVFNTGLFLVGAAHKTALANIIGKYANAEADLVDWQFY